MTSKGLGNQVHNEHYHQSKPGVLNVTDKGPLLSREGDEAGTPTKYTLYKTVLQITPFHRFQSLTMSVE